MARVLSMAVAILGCLATGTGAGVRMSPEALRGAPQTIQVDGVVLQLKAQVWRDFMPGLLSGADTKPGESAVPGRRMIAALRVAARDGQRVPKGIRVDAGWIIFGDRVWASQPAEEQPRDPAAYDLSVTMRNGPKWPPQAVVDIVVRIVDSKGVAQLLALRNQKIEAAT